jgi:hypothetical protein
MYDPAVADNNKHTVEMQTDVMHYHNEVPTIVLPHNSSLKSAAASAGTCSGSPGPEWASSSCAGTRVGLQCNASCSGSPVGSGYTAVCTRRGWQRLVPDCQREVRTMAAGML